MEMISENILENCYHNIYKNKIDLAASGIELEIIYDSTIYS